MKVLFDTNVILDLLLDREPHVEPAARLVAEVEAGALDGILGATTITNLHYLLSRGIGAAGARREVGKLLSLFEIAPVNRLVLQDALDTKMKDYEDAVLHEAGRHAGVEAVVTRDLSGFREGTLTVYSPEELVTTLETLREG